MMESLKPYPAYRDSRLPGLGDVPSHWQIKRLKNWVAINVNTLSEGTPGDYEFEYLDIGSVETGRIAKILMRLRFADAPSRARRRLNSGDTVVSTVRTYLKAVFTVREINRPLIGSTGFAVLTPRANTIPSCLGYLAQSEYFTNRVTAESVGIAYPAISETKLANIPITFPPSEEQAAIVRYLDWANARLGKAIRAKRKIIALLNEQKQAIIHRAVTLGLDPNVPLKPSGAAWLGDIPRGWDVRRAKFLFREVVERSPSGSEELLSVSHITGVTPRSQKNITMFKAESYVGHKLCRPGDLVINTMWAWMGALGSSSQVGIISPAYAVYRQRGEGLLKPLYIDLLLRTRLYIDEFTRRSTGIRSSRLRLYPEEFFKIEILVPPSSEQEEILRFIAARTERLNNSIARVTAEVDLLREYRTRLIADVVTGKLDVRAAAAELPAEEPLEAPEEETDEADEELEEEVAEPVS
jgi:type I restriction enzyme S subunit